MYLLTHRQDICHDWLERRTRAFYQPTVVIYSWGWEYQAPFQTCDAQWSGHSVQARASIPLMILLISPKYSTSNSRTMSDYPLTTAASVGVAVFIRHLVPSRLVFDANTQIGSTCPSLIPSKL